MDDNLTRCRQRFSNYEKSLSHLKTTVEKEVLNDIQKTELAWKVMKEIGRAHV